MLLFAFGVWAGTTLPHDNPAHSTLPACTQEDGSDSRACVWNDGSGDKIVNLDTGHYSYDVTTGILTDQQG
jgi:hypothetical protein